MVRLRYVGTVIEFAYNFEEKVLKNADIFAVQKYEKIQISYHCGGSLFDIFVFNKT